MPLAANSSNSQHQTNLFYLGNEITDSEKAQAAADFLYESPGWKKYVCHSY